jgi:histidinol-phosphatase (PHP family)
MLVDYHVHTGYTFDATGSVDDYCKAAQEKGIEEIAFTNHLNFGKFKETKEINVPNKFIATIDIDKIPKYYEDVEAARKLYKLKIRFGFEVDYFKDHEKMIEKILSEYPIDFVMGTPHFVNGYPVSSEFNSVNLFKGKDVFSVYMKYFERLKGAIESKLFDVMAHPDIVARYALNYEKIPFERYRKQIDAIVDSLLDCNVGIEVNTSGYSKDLNDSSPNLDFLRICKEKGLEIITIGSDAHKPSNVGLNLEKGMEKLRTAGYDRICTFERRRPKFIHIY